MEKTKQETNEAHSLYGQNPSERRLKSRNCFLCSVKPADFPPKVIRYSAWLRRLQAIPHRATVNLDKSLAKVFDRPWMTWRCLNRLRAGFTCSKEQSHRWQYYEGDTTCECGLATENTAHMMQCTLLAQPCSLDDLLLLLLFAMIRSVVKSFKVPDVEVAAARVSNESALTRMTYSTPKKPWSDLTLVLDG